MKQCVVIKGPSISQALLQIRQALPIADLLEVRLDHFNFIDWIQLKELRVQITIPFIFTLRDRTQGGNYALSEEQRMKDLLKICELKPDYIDLEYHLPIDFIKKIEANTHLSKKLSLIIISSKHLLTLMKSLQI